MTFGSVFDQPRNCRNFFKPMIVRLLDVSSQVALPVSAELNTVVVEEFLLRKFFGDLILTFEFKNVFLIVVSSVYRGGNELVG